MPWIDVGYAADVNKLIFQGADYHYRGYLDRAIASFEAVVELDWTNEYAHNQLGILYAKKNRFDQAFNEFSNVTRLDAQNTFALLWLGILHLHAGRINKAFNSFNNILLIKL